MYIRLLKEKRIEVHGAWTQYAAGDWINVGKQTALLWMARGEAEIPKFSADALQSETDAGVLLTNAPDVGRAFLGDTFSETNTDEGILRLPWSKTLIWNPALPLRPHLIAIGFLLLDTWEIACPMLEYHRLATTVGSLEEREATKGVIGDLRVPLYDPRLVFVKRTETTEDFVSVWLDESQGGEPHLALLRAIYRTKPLILALPCTWSTPGGAPSEDK